MMGKRLLLSLICLSFLLFSFAFLFLSPTSVSADDPSDLTDEVAAALLIHLESGLVVHEKNAAVNVGAGSTVKIMAGLLFCEFSTDRLREEVVVTKEMTSHFGGHCMGLKKDDVLTVEQLLYASVCGGYNDAFYVLGIHFGETVNGFCQRMNERAAELGMSASTSYTDLTGILSGSRTTANDLAKLSLAAYENELYMKLCDTDSYRVISAVGDWTVYNRNALIGSHATALYYNPYCRGIGAGSTSSDGNCAVTVAEHDGERYLCLAMSGVVGDESLGYKAVNAMIRWAYKTYAYVEVISPDTEICKIPVTISEKVSEIEVRTTESLSAYLPKDVKIGVTGSAEGVRYSIRLLNPSLEAPVREGTFVGYVAILYGDRTLGTLPLYTTESAERSGMISRLLSIRALVENRAFLAGLIFFVLSVSAWITVSAILRHRRKHRWDRYFSETSDLPRRMKK